MSSTRRRLLVFIVLALVAGAAAGWRLTPRAGPSPPRSPVKRAPLSSLVVTSPYGWRGLSFHSGVDLRARAGEPLAAVGAGVVEKTGSGGRGGQRVVLKLDDGWRAGYAHLSRVDVKEGQRVEPGARIGLAGATGHATGPHLHFELREPRSRALVDPWPLLKPHRARSLVVSALATARSDVRLVSSAIPARARKRLSTVTRSIRSLFASSTSAAAGERPV